jgi:hypothetical protein
MLFLLSTPANVHSLESLIEFEHESSHQSDEEHGLHRDRLHQQLQMNTYSYR